MRIDRPARLKTALVAAFAALALAACANSDDDDIPAPTLYNQPAPLAVTLPAAASAPAAGWAMSCAVLADGSLRCWGANQYGQIGNGGAGVSCYDGYALCTNGPAAVSPPALWQQVGAGYAHACGIDGAGAAWCWGNGDAGELGTGAPARSKVPVAVSGGLVFTRLSVSLSGGLTCALTNANALYCWGTGYYGQLGIGISAGTAYAPYRVAPMQTFTAVAVGEWHTCALDGAGAAWCWGSNHLGQVGDGTTVDRAAPTAVLGGGTYTQIVAGVEHTCALRSDGVVECWGAANQIGRSTTTSAERATPGAVAGTQTFTRIAAGANHTCALDAAGATWCWGDNSRTQFGNGATASSVVPVAVTVLPAFAQLVAGGGHTCGVTAAGAMSCWGANTFGQAGRLPY